MKSNPPSLKYLGSIPEAYNDEVVKLAGEFFDIFLDIYQKAEPIKDTERRKKMDAFRSEWNQEHIRR